MSIMTFRCDALKARISVPTCGRNFKTANTVARDLRPGDRNAISVRQPGLMPCVGCALGREHAETGKARSGLHLTVLEVPAKLSAPAPVVFDRVAEPTLEEVIERAVEAVGAQENLGAPTIEYGGAEELRTPEPVRDEIAEEWARKTAHLPGPFGGMARAQQVPDVESELRAAAKAWLATGKRNAPRKLRELGVQYANTGASPRQIEALGLKYFTVRDWCQRSAERDAQRAAKALEAMLAPTPPTPAPAAPTAPQRVVAKVPAPQRPRRDAIDDAVIDLCERSELGYRITTAVLAIFDGSLTAAVGILEDVRARRREEAAAS